MKKYMIAFNKSLRREEIVISAICRDDAREKFWEMMEQANLRGEVSIIQIKEVV